MNKLLLRAETGRATGMYILIFLFALHSSLFTLAPKAQAASPGSNAFAFLKIPDSARFSAANGAVTSWQGPDCWKTNPAALAFKPVRTASFSQDAWYMHTYMNSASINAGHFGFDWKNYTFGDTARDTSGENLGDFTDRYGTLGLSYGFKLKRYTAVGIAYKDIKQKIYGSNYGHRAFDAGFMTMPSRKITVGFSVSNIGSGKKFIDAKETLPRQYLFGSKEEMGRFRLSSEIEYIRTEKIKYLLGLEFKRSDTVTLRLGSEYQDDFNLTFGIGWQDRHYFVDFAFLPHGALNYAYITTVGIKF